MRSWFRGSGASNNSKLSLASNVHPNSNQAPDSLEVEESDLQDAMEAANLIINDDIESAEEQLRARTDSSSFHLLGLGVAIFMRSILGSEKDVMAEAASRLAECESRSWSDMKKAQKQADGGGGGWFRGSGDVTGQAPANGSQIYPAGSEFQLVNAEAQLMGAILSVMHESLTEGIKGFYKLRKAFIALDAIMQAEERALAAHKSTKTPKRDSVPNVDVEKAMAAKEHLESGGDLESLDSQGDDEKTQYPATDRGYLKRANSKSAPSSILEKEFADLDLNAAPISAPDSRTGTPESEKLRDPSRITPFEQGGPDSSIFTHPVDIFVHSGANMCFGVLLLIISMVPPAFSKLLYIIGFKGDRDRGVQMLWQSTRFNNINAGVAGLMLLAYYNGILAFSDILPSEKDVRELADENEMVGYPGEHCSALLQSMRSQYPESRMWKIEEARVLANARRVPEAIELLKSNSDSKMRQVTALNTFEMSLNALFMMDWVTMRDGFLRCIELNDWSHGMYYYFAGVAEIEMYRDAMQAGDETEAKKHKKAAVGHFQKCPAASGKKKFLAKQMPFEVFALRKIQKWEERAKEYGVDLADAVSISPAQEMTYLWSGSKRMNVEMLEQGLKCLSLERWTGGKENVEKWRVVPDEAASQADVEAAILSCLGRYEEAREKLKPFLDQDRTQFKGATKDDYSLPCAHYEMAVVAWRQASDPKSWPAEAEEVDGYRLKKIEECQEYLDHVKTWEAFVLDARIGMRVQTGTDSIAWLKKKKNWA
ncbi:Mitochondrial outer membrane protein IML2 [Cytospora mali]|uniref:Inclusion body clearance protein IML2 n=1 Tax=Cytospora mali TaxID=578113 RepID=A0A194UPR8_CYTMA|nr:Mitochondrial outer membrane protein IML2 [Valsa mali var. pyri (nom. inval.)]